MSNKVFVGGLSWDTTDSSLEEFFATVGQVTSARVVTDRNSGRSKGFGFVEFATDESAQDAVERLNGQELDGRNIKVDLATQNDQNRGAKKDRFEKRERTPAAKSEKLFIGGLSWDTTSESLNDAFAQYGEVVEARVVNDKMTGRSRGFGFVTYTNADDAEKAKDALNGQDLDGRAIRVDFAGE